MKKWTGAIIVLLLMFSLVPGVSAEGGPAAVQSETTVSNPAVFADAGTDFRGISPGTFGSEYGRMLKLSGGNWLAVYTIYDNNGYTRDTNGGTRLQVAGSTDNARTWTVLSTISDPGKDLDNGQLLELPSGDILMGARSVRWEEAYYLPVYKSTDGGATWTHLSTIDSNAGAPGSLGNPPQGIYEPHLGFLADGRIAVYYASEKYAAGSPAYSQVISLKISPDSGATWGNEIFAAWDTGNSASRPGMPVWTKMNNGKYLLVFEVCGTAGCNIYSKVSEDGATWASGLGNPVPGQNGAPYVLSLSDGRLAVTANSSTLSFSNDYGATWYTNDQALWPGGFPDYIWPSLYQTGTGELAAMTSAVRAAGGHNVRIKFLTLPASFSDSFNDGDDTGWTKYEGAWSVSGGAYSVNSTSAAKSIVSPYVSLVNYTAEADITLSNGGQASLIFDVTGPGNGTDSFKGYGAGIDTSGTVWLGRFNNNYSQLASAPAAIAAGGTYHLKVVKNSGRIHVYLDNVLKLDYTDTAYSRGTVGLRGGFGNTAKFDNVQVTPHTYLNSFDSNTDTEWTRYGGTWTLTGGVYTVASPAAFAKSVLNQRTSGLNYTVEGSIRINDSGEGSLIWNTQGLAAGTDSFRGYGAGISTTGSVWLGKFNNNYTNLGSASLPITPGTWYTVKVVVTGFRMQVYVNNTLYIDKKDTSYNNGSLGVRAGYNNNVSFDNLKMY
ncbi:sialidase family protein [Paenibacillus sp. S150]|uniref:sialidase family protein n=1 Tax=Paenibacillus sp. S150 TaxID=2749826 RepID=UPI001C59B091|nr:sialidase family protein [Paenibacillus sp. S150]MBW4080313.1 exo-alpha-sialidase [Paenibacillus sp. S150]